MKIGHVFLYSNSNQIRIYFCHALFCLISQSIQFFHNYICISSRKVFFTDYGQTPKVERCDMDGQNRTKLVDSKIVFPNGITLDLANKLVYWTDAYLDYIEVVDYEGKNRHTIIQGLLVRLSVTFVCFCGRQTRACCKRCVCLEP